MSPRRADLAFNIVHNLKLEGVLQVRYRFDGVDVKPEHVNASTVHLNVQDLSAQAEAYDAIAQHDQLEILDNLYKKDSDGVTEWVVVQVRNVMAAQAHINALDLQARLARRDDEAAKHSRLSSRANVADRFLAHAIALETELELWEEIAKDGADFRRVLALAMANLFQNRVSGTAMERAIWEAQDEGFRRFIQRARTYSTDEDAAEALLSI